MVHERTLQWPHVCAGDVNDLRGEIIVLLIGAITGHGNHIGRDFSIRCKSVCGSGGGVVMMTMVVVITMMTISMMVMTMMM